MTYLALSEVKRFSVQLVATELDVRNALLKIAGILARLELSADDRSRIELVLGEVLNNVVEHACVDCPSSPIEVKIATAQHQITLEITDHGRAMPGNTPPMGKYADLACALSDLPEGGFGWLLVRDICSDIRYERRNDVNILHLAMNVGA